MELNNYEERPKYRGDCGYDRPCPWVSCRYHLLLDHITKRFIKLDITDDDAIVEYLCEMSETCALDVADYGSQGQEEIAAFINRPVAQVAKVEKRARWKMALALNMEE